MENTVATSVNCVFEEFTVFYFYWQKYKIGNYLVINSITINGLNINSYEENNGAYNVIKVLNLSWNLINVILKNNYLMKYMESQTLLNYV